MALPVPRGSAARIAGAAAARHLLARPEIVAARRVALFAALPDEPPTREVFEALRARGRTVLFPRVAGPDALEFVAVASWGVLRPGAIGVLEPPLAAPQIPGPGDVVVVPGLGFDRRGRRLGRGKGYYDRSFPQERRGPLLLGYAWACRLVEEIPAGPFDRRVDGVVTELGSFRRGEEVDEGHGV